MQARLITLVFSTLVLAGCGGGGGESAPPPVVQETPVFQVSTQAGAGGSLSPASAQVKQGGVAAFSVTPAIGFDIDTVSGCSGTLSGTSYTTGAVNAACTVVASFKKQSFLIAAKAGSGGMISPAEQQVVYGDQAQWSVTANSGYQIDSVTGCDGSLQAGVYSVASVRSACEVNATFKKISYTVSASSSVGGTISPLSQQIQHGSSATFTLKANTGYHASTVSGCSGQLEGEVYRTGAVIADCKVEAAFAATKVQVTTQSSAGGKLSVQNPQVNYGEPLQLTLLPDAGFDITTASGCGGKLVGTVFTTAPITAECSVEARFNADTIVVFPDPHLDEDVRQALQLDNNSDISKTRLAQLTFLETSSGNVADLQGLQYATGLYIFRVYAGKISDLTPLQNLTQLHELYLTGSPLKDLKPLSTLQNLRILRLIDSGTLDLSPLRGLKLTSLSLTYTSVTDLSPLQDMPLQTFNLSRGAVTDLSALANTPLKFLSVTNTPVHDLSVLKNLKNLTTVALQGTNVTDLSALTQASGLKSLRLHNSLVQDLSILDSLNISSEQGTSLGISGCIDKSGYSRHLEQLNAFKVKHDINLSVGNDKRPDCPDTLANTSFTVNAQVSDRTLQYSWQISGSNNPVHCALYLDVDDQQPSRPASPLQACATSGSATYAGYQADQFRPAIWFDNGIGGEKLITLKEVGSAPATPKLQSLDLSQLTISAKPLLVTEREGLLRLHVTAAESPALQPQFQLQLTLDGNAKLLNTIVPAKLPVSKVHRSLTDAYQAIIPADWMKPGLRITVLQDGQALRSLTPEFAKPRPLAIRIVPIQLGDQIASLPDISVVETAVKTFWPFSKVDVRARAPYQLKGDGSKSSAYVMLPELRDLRAIEDEDVYYYGYFKPEMGDNCCGGLGYIGYPVAVGFDNDKGEILAHELGHNFGRPHVNCGGASGVDSSYPYPGNSIGSVGLSLELQHWISPATHADVMSYCDPTHVSDYNVALVQNFIEQNPPAAFAAASQAQIQQSQAGRGLYLSGTLDGNSLQIRTLVPLSRAPRNGSNSDYVMRVQDTQGLWSQYNVQLLQIDHQPDATARDFQVELPDLAIQRFEIWHADVMLAAQDNQHPNAAGKGMVQQQLSSSQFQLDESANQICVNWPAGQDATVSLLYQLDGQDTVLALNETAANFCRDSSALAAGGDWRLVWRQQLAVREFRQPR